MVGSSRKEPSLRRSVIYVHLICCKRRLTTVTTALEKGTRANKSLAQRFHSREIDSFWYAPSLRCHATRYASLVCALGERAGRPTVMRHVRSNAWDRRDSALPGGSSSIRMSSSVRVKEV